MAKFKVGDMVRSKRGRRGTDNQINSHDVYTVASIAGPWIGLKEDAACECCFYANDFVLVESQSELQRLVDDANRGFAALEILRRQYGGKFQYRHAKNREWQTHCGAAGTFSDYEYRIKPEPAFEPFAVGQNWKVELVEDGKRVKVGCQEFNRAWLHGALVDLVKRNCSKSDGPIPLTAIRSGIRYSSHEITWSDADRLLEALEKVKG